MDFGFSEEQDLLRQEVRKLLEARSPMSEVRRVTGTPEGFSRELWKELGELGYLGLALPEAHGGAGLGWVDLVVLLEEAGRKLLPAPLVSTLLAGAAIVDAGSEQQRERWLPGLADGSRIGALALLDAPDVWSARGVTLRARGEGDALVLDGVKPWVQDAEQADWFVVAYRTGKADDDVAFAVVDARAPGVSITDEPTLDLTKRMGTVRFDGVRIAADVRFGDTAAFERLLDRGAAAVCAEMIGVAEAAVALTVQYALDRVQFGSPIGRYQGVKHPLAEMHVQIESLKSLLYYAAWALDRAPDLVPRAVSEAKALGTLALSRIGIDTVQLHGAVGYTLEYDAQLFLRRAKWARPMFGDEDHHADRLADLGGY